MKYLVTGASGLVGCELTLALSQRYGPQSVVALIGPPHSPLEEERKGRLSACGVHTLELDLLGDPVVGPVLPEFDVLFHLAAYTRTEEDSPDVRVNDRGTDRLLRSLQPRLGGTRVVFTSSLLVTDPALDASGRMPGPVIAGTPCTPKTPYGRTKLRAEAIVKEYAARLGFNYTIFRLCTVYGPGYRAGGMFDIVPSLLQKGSWLVRVNWPGRISLIDVGDLCRILLDSALSPETANRTFLVSSGEDPTMGGIMAQIAAVLGMPRRPIALSPAARAMAGRLLAKPALWTHLPYPLMISAWRASMMIGGLYCDGSELTKSLNATYRPWQEGFRDMYGAPRPASR